MWKNENHEKWVFWAEIRTSDSFKKKEVQTVLQVPTSPHVWRNIKGQSSHFLYFGPPASKNCVLKEGEMFIVLIFYRCLEEE